MVKIDAIVLAAGYATRLYPLTENTPKPLLNIAGKPIIEHIIKKLEQINLINKIYVVTNDKFEQHFRKWLSNFNAEKPIEIINDRTKSNEGRLGALGDIHYTINLKNINSEIVVIAGDNIFEDSLADAVNFFKKRKSSVIVLHDVKDFELARNYGIVEVSSNIVVNFEEKPTSPKSTLASTGIYLFPKKTISLIKKYIAQGNNPDKTGSFIEWLHKRDVVYSYITDKGWYDIGSVEQLEKADKKYGKTAR
ncbi:nucleotidyltransferase family protein [Candidatus Woesearchaeota archaeon]|nr:nucleotidyltransferase family protein [Candidatus Woesearchaeota archaeon]